jgi:hypothetical protein
VATELYAPGAHSRQPAAPTVYEPGAAHVVHTAEEAAGATPLYAPGAQAVHAMVPDVLAKVPGRHCLGADRPLSGQAFPVGHTAHSMDPVDDW